MKIKTGELTKKDILSKNMAKVLEDAKKEVMDNISKPGVKRNHKRRITLHIDFIPVPNKDEIQIVGSIHTKLAPTLLSFEIDSGNLKDFLNEKGVKEK